MNAASDLGSVADRLCEARQQVRLAARDADEPTETALQTAIEYIDEATGHLDRLYYTTGYGQSGDDRTLHWHRGCRHLESANSVQDCAPTHAPRGGLCSTCTPAGVSLDDLQKEPVPAGGED